MHKLLLQAWGFRRTLCLPPANARVAPTQRSRIHYSAAPGCIATSTPAVCGYEIIVLNTPAKAESQAEANKAETRRRSAKQGPSGTAICASPREPRPSPETTRPLEGGKQNGSALARREKGFLRDTTALSSKRRRFFENRERKESWKAREGDSERCVVWRIENERTRVFSFRKSINIKNGNAG